MKSTGRSRRSIQAVVKDIREAAARASQSWSAPPRSKSRATGRAAAQGRPQGFPGAERPLSRAGSLYRRAGRRAERHHRRLQHGRPRHRHPARRQFRHARAAEELAEVREAQARRQDSGDPRQHPETEGKGARRRRLYVLATERHESRRIDNQLRGRSRRQGDPADPNSTCPSRTI